MTDDRVLVSRVLLGEMQAFTLLIRQHERLVAHMIGRVVKGEQDREELCQDTFLKVYDSLSDFNFKSKLSTWIATIAYRRAINHIRKKRIETLDVPDDHSLSAHFISDEDLQKTVEDGDLRHIVLTLVDRFPVHYRTILTLYHVDGMNYPEIGEITGLPEGTVKNYLFRARNLLKEKAKHYLGKETVL